MYWDQEKSTYILAPDNNSTPKTTTSNAVSAADPVLNQISKEDPIDPNSTSKKGPPKENDQRHDKVKVAKKIVKDMEKWAKQLNQKKDMNFMAAPVQVKEEPVVVVQRPVVKQDGYADVGFSILESRDRINEPTRATAWQTNNSDSDSEQQQQQQQYSGKRESSTSSKSELVSFENLTCLLCKRAFPSMDVLDKHCRMSKLHKENLQKYEAGGGNGGGGDNGYARDGDNSGNESNLSYRDRAKERRLKYGESDPPPVNKSRERFEREFRRQNEQMEKQNSYNLASKPIGESNLGNRLLQKMGWSEGQGLGRTNQGRTEIIEVHIFRNNAGMLFTSKLKLLDQ